MINARLLGVDGALLDDTREFGAWADWLGADRLADLDAATTILNTPVRPSPRATNNVVFPEPCGA